MQSEFNSEVQGIATGNGVLDFASMNRTLPEFLYGYGLVSEAQWSKFKQCCDGDGNGCNSANECGQVVSYQYQYPFDGHYGGNVLSKFSFLVPY